MLGAGRSLAPAILFFGCRDPDVDNIHSEELDRWAALGAVDVRRAFSRRPESSNGAVHVQDRIWTDRQDVDELFQRGAKVFVCGNRNMGESVREVAIKMIIARRKELGQDLDEGEAAKLFDGMRNERYATDVFD